MRQRAIGWIVAVGSSLALVGGACGGDDGGDDATVTPAPTATAEALATPSSTAEGLGGPIASGPSVSAGRTYTADEAQAIVASAALTPDDLPSVWITSTDNTTDAATAAANNPDNAASIERCGQLVSRLAVLSPPEEDLASRYIGGENVSYFTNLTVYATDEGAVDCANEAAAEFAANPTALAEAFGSVFVDPAAVTVTPTEFPQVGEGSFAANLTGTVQAGGFDVTITILIVAWRQGNVSAVVGSAASFDPPRDDLYPLVELVAERIAATQAQ